MTATPRPVHLRWRSAGLVFVGGSLGTAARYGLGQVVPLLGPVPVATVLINAVGAFALGLLLESLARAGPDEGLRQDLRLGVGTGVLGGFTTYSALATATVSLFTGGHVVAAAAYALGTLVLGLAAATLGIGCVGRRRGRAG